MITTFNDFKNTLNLQPGKKVKFNQWIGTWQGVYLAQDIMLCDDDMLYFTTTELVQPDDKPIHCDSYHIAKTIHFENDFVHAETLNEAIIDARDVFGRQHQHFTNRCEECQKAIAEHMKQVYAIIDEIPGIYGIRSEIIKKAFDYESEDNCDYAKLVHYLDLEDGSDVIDEDTCWEIRRLFHMRGFNYDNPDNEDINTYVSLQNVVSVQVDMHIEDRDCVCVTTTDGKEHHIFKDKDPDLFNALNTLYS